MIGYPKLFMPQSPYTDPFYMRGSSPPLQPTKFSQSDQNVAMIINNILDLKNPDKRQQAINKLSNKRQNFKDLAVLLWYSTGTIAILLQEIVQIYPDLSPPRLNFQVSNRACSVLGLLQSLALHSAIRKQFIHAHIPLYLYPFLNTSCKMKFFQNVRVTSLGVIGALVKCDDSQAIGFLMQTEIIPLCLRIMKRGQELSRTVATFIVQKILNDNTGLEYICQTGQRFYAVSTVLSNMIEEMANNNKQDCRLLRHILKCYIRLAQNPKANDALKQCLPQVLKNSNALFIRDQNNRRCHSQLHLNLFKEN